MTAIESIHSLSNLKYVGILDYIEDTVFDKKKQTSLHKNSLFSKQYVIRNVIVMENYK